MDRKIFQSMLRGRGTKEVDILYFLAAKQLKLKMNYSSANVYFYGHCGFNLFSKKITLVHIMVASETTLLLQGIKGIFFQGNTLHNADFTK